MRRHLTYANVIATLALVFAMSGGAVAAQHYLISSTHQISPRVLKKLRGARGRTGATGKAGANGAAGAPGANGREGPTGPSNGYSVFSGTVHDLKFPENVAMASVAVPAGSYLISAQAEAVNETTARQLFSCEIVNDVNADVRSASATVEPIGGTSYDGRVTVSVQAASTLVAAGHLILQCSGSANTGTLKGREAQIDAVRVATLSAG